MSSRRWQSSTAVLLVLLMANSALLSAGGPPLRAVAGKADDQPTHATLNLAVFQQPEYPREGVIRALRWAVPLSLLLSAALTVTEAVSPGSSAAPVSPEIAAAGAVSVGLLTLDISYRAERRRFREATALQTRQLDVLGYQLPEWVEEHPPHEAASEAAGAPAVAVLTAANAVDEFLFQLAESAAARGEIMSALEAYDAISKVAPGSRYVPEALYGAALIRLGLGRYREAKAQLELLRTEFPECEVAARSSGLLETLRAMP